MNPNADITGSETDDPMNERLFPENYDISMASSESPPHDSVMHLLSFLEISGPNTPLPNLTSGPSSTDSTRNRRLFLLPAVKLESSSLTRMPSQEKAIASDSLPVSVWNSY